MTEIEQKIPSHFLHVRKRILLLLLCRKFPRFRGFWKKQNYVKKVIYVWWWLWLVKRFWFQTKRTGFSFLIANTNCPKIAIRFFCWSHCFFPAITENVCLGVEQVFGLVANENISFSSLNYFWPLKKKKSLACKGWFEISTFFFSEETCGSGNQCVLKSLIYYFVIVNKIKASSANLASGSSPK